MSGDSEFRCFIGGLSWSVSDRGLRDAFEKFGHLLEAKVVIDKVSGRSRGFGFVTFDEQKVMEEAIDAMNGIDLDGRTINVDRARPQQGSRRDYDNLDRDHRDRGREYGSGQGTGGGGCFNCGKSNHFARECPSDGAKGSRYEGGENRYGGGGGARHGLDRNEDRFGRRNRDNGADRYSRDRAGPYDRRGSGGFDLAGYSDLVAMVAVL